MMKAGQLHILLGVQPNHLIFHLTGLTGQIQKAIIILNGSCN